MLGKRRVRALSQALQQPDGKLRLCWLEREISGRVAEWHAEALTSRDRDEELSKILDSCADEIETIIRASFECGLGARVEDHAEALERHVMSLIDEVRALREALDKATHSAAYDPANA